jgi:hypothetical protein
MNGSSLHEGNVLIANLPESFDGLSIQPIRHGDANRDTILIRHDVFAGHVLLFNVLLHVEPITAR